MADFATPNMNLRPLLHTLLLILLTLCVGSLGPAALASVPRSLTVNTQEEERGAGESDEIASLATSVLRPAKPLGVCDRWRRASWSCESNRRIFVREAPARESTLCALHVRIQV